MTKSDFAWNYVLDHEDAKRAGTITNDGGGETRFGIAQKYHPSEFPALAEMPVANALARAETIFLQEYWQPVFDQITDARIAAKLVDIDFNLGAATGSPKGMGVLVAQMACHQLGNPVPETAFFGPLTLAAVNGLDPDKLLAQMCAEELSHILAEYADRAITVPPGLINRAKDQPKLPSAATAA